MDTSKYEDLFISEAEEYIEKISNSILLLEKDKENTEAINEIFRAMHTIKGMAASMGYINISQIAHALEDVMDLIRMGKIELYTELIDILLKGNDIIDSLVHKNPVDEDIIRSFKAVLTSLQKTPAGIKETQKEVESKNAGIKVEFVDDVVLKSARAFVVIKIVQDAGIYESTVPSYDDIMKENFEKSFIINVNDEKKAKELIDQIKSIPEIKNAIFEQEKKEEIKKFEINNQQDVLQKQVAIKKDIKVALERLDALQNYASELVIARGRLQQLAYKIQNEDLINALQNTSKIITNIQDEVMKIRMVPVGQVFDRYPRYVRDLAKKLNKKVDFEIKGRNIELDRSLLNALADPLLHLLRNSLDHGIESPNERKKNKKDETGKIVLEAKRLKNAVVIIVKDDGKGLSSEKILKKAIEKGLISKEQAKTLSKQDIYHIITRSGFSTKEQVSDVSGRGVGVDAVQSVLKKIGGSLEIQSEEGKGTSFILKVPLTLAIIKSLIIRVANETYIVPLTHISETIDINKEQIQSIMGKEVFLLREEVIPIIRLSRVFHIDSTENREKYSLVIVDIDENQFGILIDEFIEQTEVVVKSLKGLLSGIQGIAGVTILNNGLPSFIIDVPGIFEMAKVG